MTEPMLPTNNGTINILNVGHGDTKIVFDKDDPQECIRAARIIKDMLRHGYALMIEMPREEGQPRKFQRVYDFKEDSYEYIIADLDPVPVEANSNEPTPAPNSLAGRRRKAVSAHTAKGVAIARTAGG